MLKIIHYGNLHLKGRIHLVTFNLIQKYHGDDGYKGKMIVSKAHQLQDDVCQSLHFQLLFYLFHYTHDRMHACMYVCI